LEKLRTQLFFSFESCVTIFVTNDDGVSSPGLHALAAALASLGDVWVIAPDRERNATGHALTLHKPLRITKVSARVYSINGTPTDCVNLGLKKIVRKRPALLVSGINRGVNLGDDVTYSGTVSAALEGAIMGIPSLAISQEADATPRWDVAADYAVRIARALLRFGLPPETFLNVNVPNRPATRVKGVRVTSLSRRRFDDPIVEKIDPRGRKYYWIAGTRISWERRDDSDFESVRQGWVSLTPLHFDMTAYDRIAQVQEWVPFLGTKTTTQGKQLTRKTAPSRRRTKTEVSS
jgi:5'-nucleotidase